jgi:hypothetical protein
MSKVKQPSRVANSVMATVFFTQQCKPAGYGQGFVVRFAVAPKVGDKLSVDQYSIRKIPQEDLHQCDWQVVDVRHEVNLDVSEQDDEDLPWATLYVTVHPAQQ